MSQLVEIEDYKCQFCDNRIISGYRCTDCYIKKIDNPVPMEDNPYKDHSFEREYEGQYIPNTVENSPFDIQDLRGLGFQEPWINTFTSAGNASNIADTKRIEYTVSTSSSADMGFGLGTNSVNRPNTFQSEGKNRRHITNDAMCRWRGTPVE